MCWWVWLVKEFFLEDIIITVSFVDRLQKKAYVYQKTTWMVELEVCLHLTKTEELVKVGTVNK